MVLALVFGGLLALLLLASFSKSFLDFAGLGKAGRQTGRWLEEVTVESNGSDHKIALVEVEGLITSQAWDGVGRNMVDLIEDQLKMAARDKAVKAVRGGL